MRWYDQLLEWVLAVFLLGTPVAVLYGCKWWYRNRDESGLRVWVSRVGVGYSAFVLVLMAAAVLTGWTLRPGEEFAHAWRWAKIVDRCGLLALTFAAFGKGRVRVAFVVTAFGGFAFAYLYTAL